jgi:hypothetical protein
MIIDELEKTLNSGEPNIIVDNLFNIDEALPDKERFYDALIFSDVWKEDLDSMTHMILQYIEMISNSETVIVVPQVVEEFQRYETVLAARHGRMTRILEQHKDKGYFTRRQKKQKDKYKRKWQSSDEETPRLMKRKRKTIKMPPTYHQYKRVIEEVKTLKWNISQKLPVIRDPNFYNDLFEAITTISEEREMKYDNIPKPYKHEYKDIRTDEHIVTTALYLLSEGEDSTIVSHDADIVRLLLSAFRYFCGVEETYEEGMLRARLREDPIKLNFIYQGTDVGTNVHKSSDIDRDGITGFRRVYDDLDMEDAFRGKVRKIVGRLTDAGYLGSAI